MDLPVIGETIKEEEKNEIEESISELNDAGMVVKKIINYKGGSTKFIAGYAPQADKYKVRKDLEGTGWKVGAPYYSHGSILGFRVSKEGPASKTNVWGGA